MMKKSLKIILTLVLVLASVFGLSKIRSAHADGATGKIQITSKTITPTKSPVDQYTDIKVDLTFNVPNGVKPGDQAVITLPPNLKFIKDAEFEVRSPNGELVSEAVINAANKTITLTYQDYVKGKSNISGSMFFAVRVEPATASPSKVPITLNVDNNPVPVGEVDFVVDPGNAEKVLDKVSWDTKHLADGGITRQYEVRVNATKEPLTEAVVTDQLQTEGMSYVEDSFVIKKGNWAVNSSHKLDLKNGQVVSLPVEFGADKKSFKVSLGNVAQGEGYSIVYKVKIPYTPANDEKFFNNVTLNAKKVVETKSNPFVYQTEGGKAQGYTFSINLKKVDGQDENTALAGAEFNVIRVATGAVVGKLTTNAKGEASIGGLLNTAYQLVETKAPEGYELDATPIDVKSEDFGTTKTALKTVTNKKIVKEPTPTSAVIELDKALTGRDLVDGEFSFELYEGANKLQTVTNKSGKVTFESISYTAEGEHTYTVKEVKGDNATIAYDASEKQVTVKVTRDGDALKAEVVYPESKTFTNAFTPNATTATIELTKELTGRDLVDGEFSFELYEGANKLQTVTNKSGKVTFESISYTAEGEHTYTVKEVKGNDATITYDASEKQVTVKVTRDGDALKAEVVYPESKTFTNSFTPKATTATIELSKELTGRDLVDGEFSFELYEGANKLQTVTNKSGKVTFDAISYTAEGEHTYTVKEVKGDNATIAYDTAEKQVTVKVTRDGDALQAEVVYPENKTFTNAFTPNATTATIELTKELTGRELVDGEFSFELYEGANKLQTVTNKSGKVTFDAISYTAEGEHTYTVKEVKGNVPGITYDTAEKQVTVQVTKDGDNLKATVVYPESKVFANTYSAPSPAKAQISASKILEGRDLKDGEFSFNLLDEAGEVLQTKQNAADGSVAFDEISYSQEDAGKTFHYTIKEVIPQSQEKGMTYDQASIEVTVTVTKDDASNTIKATVAYGAKTSFTNTFVTSEIPPTPPVVEKPEAKLYTIQLHKVNGEGRALAGAVFGLFEADGSTPVANPYGEGQATATSDANGLVSFVGFEAKDYVVKELTAPEGYQLSTASIAVSATELSAASDLVVDKGNVVNQPFTEIPPTPPVVEKPELTLYSIQLHKVNNEGKALAGAVFGLFEADGVTPVANPYGEGQATATSDANGLVTFTGLEAKDYVVKEITAPEGYQLSEEAITVSSNQLIASTNQVLDQGKVVNKPFTAIPPTPPVVEKPELKLYTIQLHKVNGEGRALAGAVFGLFEADGSTPVANPYGEGQATATSDANGLVSFVGFEAKDYVVKELTAPAGYQLSTNPITVTAEDYVQATDLVVDKGNVVNELTPPTPPTPPTTPPTTPSTDKPKGDKPSGSQPKEEKEHTLPSTGETVSEGLVATGLALAVAGSALVYKKREN
ncbi:Spy0128 family protein [Streptococcus ilei]|uniref:Spy0128 family protein n=1 Tax=Streptococcus ilei TaxID=1156431 RepID=UPI0009DC4032|nr:FctA domain-containing protein [Streptococcus ilei]